MNFVKSLPFLMDLEELHKKLYIYGSRYYVQYILIIYATFLSFLVNNFMNKSIFDFVKCILKLVVFVYESIITFSIIVKYLDFYKIGLLLAELFNKMLAGDSKS